jgi:capsular exopolysaccharide synthesis family protein
MSKVYRALKRASVGMADPLLPTENRAVESPSPSGRVPSNEFVVEVPGGDAGIPACRDDGMEIDLNAVRLLPQTANRVTEFLTFTATQSQIAEQYRIARTKIVQRLSRPFVLVVSSPSVGDGKTFTALNLAISLALNGEGRTLLIDADLRHPSVHRLIGAPIEPGVAEVLSGACALQDALFRIEQVPSFYVLPGGSAGSNSADLLATSGWRALSTAVRSHFSHVIVDSPPIDIVADYDLIAAAGDAVLLVIRPDHTDRACCAASFTKVRPKLIGVLINAAAKWLLWRTPAHNYRYYSDKHLKGRQNRNGDGTA